ncbi:MAG: GNAT family N-acetyltransferase [Candidatus Lokiarchaeota archaeon]|nr:GNAT family N-acetyltransferase [Candidatus Lokiarchaeota archaeon]
MKKSKGQHFHIRRATEKDIEQIGELWKELMDFHAKRDIYFQRGKEGHVYWKKRILEAIEKKSTNLVLVAENSNQIVGYIYAYIAEFLPVFDRMLFGFIVDISVTDKCRKSGIGRELVLKTLNWFKQRHIKRIEVVVSVKNEISTKFWRKVGFNEFKEILFTEIKD